MLTEDRSLRSVVEKWFGRDSHSSLHLSRVMHSQLGRNHCLRVDLPHSGNFITVFFFRHDDGGWSVFPPATKRGSLYVSSF
ncbi:hypothetical protein PTE30175_05165 [Pandoraea terrae]|uniref:Uncharacterized protein n=1 Tax=Pandoraea terrae TaxID=1537710 RepID=A0A5E4Z9J0_9BURK|nr:hypothetical protein PTE30175_05165 [Pandoraea terrae]